MKHSKFLVIKSMFFVVTGIACYLFYGYASHQLADNHQVTVIDKDNIYVVEVKDGEKVDEIIKDEDDFIGWYLKDDQYNFNDEVHNDIVINAKYKKVVFEVIFNDENTNNQLVEYGERVEVPDSPVREGFQFIGWIYNNQIYNFDSPVISDMTLEPYFVIESE